MAGQSPSSQKLLFLSDVHLGGFSKEENERIESELVDLIDYCLENLIKIYVLGDLFDYWMEYPGHLPETGGKLRERFSGYNKVMGPTIYITGNHDNWTGPYFKEIGFDVKHDYELLKAGNKNVLLLHGDGTLTSENKMARPFLHRLLRNRFFVSIFQKLAPPAAGLWIMKWYSRASRAFSGSRTDPAVLDKWAEKRLREPGTDAIICGHDHIPREKRFFFGTYLNLGTFYRHRTVGLYNNGNIDLVFWDGQARQLSNYYSSINSEQP